MPRPRAVRKDYAVFREMTTRWRDNDVYGHLNNAVYYEYVDTAVNGWIIDSGALEVPHGPVVGLVAETGCVYHAAIRYPDRIGAGLRVARLGTSSVSYEVGLFRNDDDEASAEARFVHVYVDARTHRPVPLPDPFRDALRPLVRDPGTPG